MRETLSSSADPAFHGEIAPTTLPPVAGSGETTHPPGSLPDLDTMRQSEDHSTGAPSHVLQGNSGMNTRRDSRIRATAPAGSMSSLLSMCGDDSPPASLSRGRRDGGGPPSPSPRNSAGTAYDHDHDATAPGTWVPSARKHVAGPAAR